MKIKDLLKIFLPTKEIIARVNNKSIKINQDVLTAEDLNTDIEVLEEEFLELGDFIQDFISSIPPEKIIVFKTFNVRDFFGGETNVEIMKPLSNHLLLTIGKKLEYVFKYK
jgi:hypothetical protein